MMRALPSNLCMAEAVPFGQRWNYHTSHPLDLVLDPAYFLPVRDMMRPGDEIRVCRIAQGRVLSVLDLIVVEVLPQAIEIKPLGAAREIPTGAKAPAPPEPPPPERYIATDGKVRFDKDRGVHQVTERGRVVAETPDKDEAYRIAQGDQPLPALA